MRQVFPRISNVVRRSRNPYVNGIASKSFRALFVFCLAAFALTSSSFKKEIRQSRVEKTGHLKKPVPFKGRLSVSLEAGGTSGTGIGSHIGSFEYTSVDFFDEFFNVTGTGTITAANGDKIFTSFSGYLEPLANSLLGVTIENAITGGTGRFQGASGSFTSTGTANPVSGAASTTFKGTISY